MGLEKQRRRQLPQKLPAYSDAQIESLKALLGVDDLRGEVDTLMAQSISVVGSEEAIDLGVAGAINVGFDWPAAIADSEMFLFTGIISDTYIARLIEGKEVNDVTESQVSTVLVAASGIELYDHGGTIRGRLGKTAAGDVLIDPSVADNDARIAIYKLF